MDDDLIEGVETIYEVANIISPSTALFGGALQSTSGKITANIIDDDQRKLIEACIIGFLTILDVIFLSMQ